MSYFYGLLAVSGWVWTVIVGVFLIVNWKRLKSAQTTDAKQH
jgi:hypothetical protein